MAWMRARISPHWRASFGRASAKRGVAHDPPAQRLAGDEAHDEALAEAVVRLQHMAHGGHRARPAASPACSSSRLGLQADGACRTTPQCRRACGAGSAASRRRPRSRSKRQISWVAPAVSRVTLATPVDGREMVVARPWPGARRRSRRACALSPSAASSDAIARSPLHPWVFATLACRLGRSNGHVAASARGLVLGWRAMTLHQAPARRDHGRRDHRKRRASGIARA